MRTLLAALAAVAVTVAPASAGLSAKTRTTTQEYVTSGNTPLLRGDITLNGNHVGSVVVPIQLREYQIELSATDKTGLPVLVEVVQRIDDQAVTLTTVCGKTAKPLKLKKTGVNVELWLLAGQCGSGVSMPTAGTVTSKIYRPR